MTGANRADFPPSLLGQMTLNFESFEVKRESMHTRPTRAANLKVEDVKDL
jgi:hypothetical protein